MDESSKHEQNPEGTMGFEYSGFEFPSCFDIRYSDLSSSVTRLVPNYDGMRIGWDHRSIRSRNVSFGRVRYKPGGYCGPRVQQDYELVVLHSGGGEARVDHARRVLATGHAWLFLPRHRELFRFSADQETHHSWCSIRPGFLSDALRRELASAPHEAPCTALFDRILSTAFLIGAVRDAAGARVVDHLGLALFAEYLDSARSATGGACGSACIQRALRYMEEHFGEENCLVETQRAAGCSCNALIYKFTEAVGVTPARYLWRLRTEKGLALLAETGLTVAEIAFKCGFKNPFHFSRRVKQHQGVSPREARRRAWV